MIKALFAGALALASIGLLSATTQKATAAETEMGQTGQVANVNLVRIKSVLRLTPAQEVYWPRVEAALRAVSREQAASGGYFNRLKRSVVGIVLNGRAVARLAAAARPLLAVLDDNQRQAAFGLAQEMGLGPMLAALN